MDGKSRTASQSGFTLIELLVAIVITNILIALPLPAVQKERETVNEASAVETLRQVVSAQQKALMRGSAEKTPGLLRVHRMPRLTKALLELRERSDGRPAMDDWVS